ncbi:histidine kinase N-terminal 7TM domain-containing protein [Natrinema versiforme]|uniref:histidine kinase N-terminal 7TM domain-containing protein n=1 Tax=Natrinema versiforme TaxID=88724 RepID=UPI0022771E06|nr:histidine kinase N-terminal 7TM domain-containing protein [Natrinema versiforme]
MGWVINPYSVVLLLSLVVAVGTAVAAARSRPAAGSVPLTMLMASVALWLGAHVLEIESATFLWKARWADLQWLPAAVIPTLFLVFALEYTGRDRWLTRRRLGLLVIEPAVMIGLLATNDRMRLLWGTPVEATVALDIPWGSRRPSSPRRRKSGCSPTSGTRRSVSRPPRLSSWNSSSGATASTAGRGSPS